MQDYEGIQGVGTRVAARQIYGMHFKITDYWWDLQIPLKNVELCGISF